MANQKDKKKKHNGAPFGNKRALGNKGGGRHSEYKPEYAKMAYKYALLGCSDDKLAECFDVTRKTILDWKQKHSEFSTQILEGKEKADGKVASALFRRAIGCSVIDTDIKVVGGKIVKTDLKKNFPPDVSAAIHWLKVRNPKIWRDVQHLEANINTVTETTKFQLKTRK